MSEEVLMYRFSGSMVHGSRIQDRFIVFSARIDNREQINFHFRLSPNR